MKRLGVTLTALSLALTGCAIGPDYQRPATADVQRYRHAGAANAQANPDVAWWQAFGDPVLSSLVEEAMRNNYDARVAAARIEQFRGQMETARAGLFPQAGVSFGADRQKRSLFANTPLSGFDGPSNQYQALGNVSWEIDLWGKIRRQTEAAKADLWAAEYARRGVDLSLAASVAQGYLSLRGLDAQLAIAQQTLDARAHALAIFKLRYQHGVISEMELSQAQDDFYSTEAAIPPLRESIAQTENALSVLIGSPPGPIPRGKTLAGMQLPPLDADPPVNLLNRRPDLLQAEQNAVAANALVGATEALYLPTLSLSAFLGQAASTTGALWHGASQIWGISAGLTQPLFEGGAIQGQVRVARSQREQALLTYQGAVLSALADVDNALVATQESGLRLASLENQQKALVIYASQSDARYESGYSSYLEVTNAQEKLFNAQLAAAQGRVDLMTGYVTLYKALGGGWTAVPEDVRNAGETTVAPPASKAVGTNG
ncbi:efflux transporter outer membrane subunit [Paraburkholderia haematera]|uniref:Outer membrane protein OprM n=1 Tax=Paraburkholderia haematera TaxID=2793077 RepID=A0ABM8SCU6_9BURK|nr:efflux transporter outer membrane subunit [Paraburkholderia haematera]CAE6801690.1 Outer membrane protein OprM [Paraburkholderia haematera]